MHDCIHMYNKLTHEQQNSINSYYCHANKIIEGQTHTGTCYNKGSAPITIDTGVIMQI